MKWLLIAMYVAKMVDVGTTEMALARGARETNPTQQGRPALYLTAAIAPIVIYKLTDITGSRKGQAIACAVTVAIWSLGTYNNYRVYKGLEGRTPPSGLDRAKPIRRPRGGFRVLFALRF